MMTTGSLFATGDCIAQQFDAPQGENNSHDVLRTARMGFWGGCVFSPAVFKWYQYLARWFPGQPTWTNTVQKIATDQLFFGPMVNAGLMAYTVTLTGGSGADVVNKIRSDWWHVVQRQWCLWPATNILTFGYVPYQLQVPFISVVSFIWSIYLSYCNGAGKIKVGPSHPHTARTTTLPAEPG